ncbi:variable large family protein (plasmid) [Borrelia coriaceae]|uniref:Variable large protein n=1 Tax=Borrelia coriaceae ATCC 43381 TaxID=1408429 RepID=W5SW95_9SPIR|nr:variable large family protein [Borrelia coriaceae]AHH11459.1 Variable outer membrane protein [Borrelia coriaceae ATCC 43381]UPA17289.1 variable large family protein [Borrelia coriaceae]
MKINIKNIKNIKIKSICATLFISLFLSCSNGIEELEKRNIFLSSLANLGNGFLSVFTSFGDMFTDTLSIRANTKKSDINRYFNDIEKTMISIKEKLKAEVAKNGNYEKIKTIVDKFITDTLDKIAAGAKEAAKGAEGEVVLGGATAGGDAAPADITSVSSLIEGIKTIVEVVLKDKGNAEANGTEDNDKKDIGKLFSKASDNGSEVEAAKASASIGAVSGADILKAIVSSDKATENKDIDQAGNSAEIATAKNSGSTKETKKKDAVIAGGIALRAMAKGGKFATKSSETKSAHAINGVAASAVTKVLNTLIIAIRSTVDIGLKKINDVLATVTHEDKSADVTTPAERNS